MAVDACSERSTPNTSPRISFSIDLHNTDPEFLTQTIPSRSSPIDSFSDFDFFFENSIDIEPSSADELFSDGLIRPKQFEPKSLTLSRQSSLSNPKKDVSFGNSKSEQYTKDIVLVSEPKFESKSFWRIKRSSSVHCENSNKKSSFWSLPLLSRSNSTGSVPYAKIKSIKDNKIPENANKQTRFSTSSSSSCSSQRPPLKKKSGAKYNSNGVRITLQKKDRFPTKQHQRQHIVGNSRQVANKFPSRISFVNHCHSLRGLADNI